MSVRVVSRALLFASLLALVACGPRVDPCAPPTSTPGPVGLPAPTLDGGALLWVGAHPDDETSAAPLLEEWCRPGRARCTFLVLTRGEGGNCGLPGGCTPDLQAVRVKEMEASAHLFDAGLVQETLPNASFTPDDARARWTSEAGSEDALVERVAAVLRAGNFDTLVTFDSRHGVTCHGEHRVAGGTALLAADKVGLPRSRVLLLGSRMYLRESKPGVRCQLGFSAAVADDTALLSIAPTEAGWARAVAVMRTHASQFDADTLSAAEGAPATLRSTWYLWASDVVQDDPRYAGLCR